MGFDDRDTAFLQRLLPVISLGEALHDESRAAPPLRPSVDLLSPRERDIVSYVAPAAGPPRRHCQPRPAR
jgi:hypothetical protein